MEIPAPVGGSGQLTVNAAQSRLADLVTGQLYRVQITDILPGKVEFLLGNQYLLATTPFKFSPGDIVNLRLTERTPQLLTFQLSLPSSAQSAAASRDMATLLRAVSAPNNAENRAAISTLMRAGITVNTRSLGEVAQLINTVPPESVAAFLPLYKDLLAKGLRPEMAVLEQMAKLSGATPELSALLSNSLNKLKRRRSGGRDSSQLLDEAVEAAITSLDDDHLPTATLLREKLQLLYGSPEKVISDALCNIPEDPPKQPAPQTVQVEFGDLTNIAMGEEIPGELVVALNIVQALRIGSSMFNNATDLALPVELDGELTEVQLSINILAEQYYQKDYSVRVRVQNETQGRVEIQVMTRGPGVNIAVMAEDSAVLSAYRECFDDLREQINADGAFYLRRIEAAPQSV